jgi:hypothetical protein
MESEQIAEVITRIKASGYDIYLVLEATVGFTKQDEGREGRPSSRSSRVSGRAKMPEFKLNSHDRQFLKALRISFDDAA